MNPKDIQDIITILERAPLANMQEAKAVAQQIEKLVQYFTPKSEAVVPDRGSP